MELTELVNSTLEVGQQTHSLSTQPDQQSDLANIEVRACLLWAVVSRGRRIEPNMSTVLNTN